MTDAARGFGIYVHWPYCSRICPYCDFNVVRERGREDEKAALVEAIILGLQAAADETGPRVLTSIFFGGGTPSLMDPASAGRVIDTARGLWAPAQGLEISLEANPTDAERGRFADFARAGVNRLSLGVQSLRDEALVRLGRNHDARAARSAIESAQAAFPRVSVDLIYALPGQTLDAWTRDLEAVAAAGVEHISPYQLTIERGTAFDRAVRRGSLVPPAEDAAADAYETTQAVLGAAGFEAYEVSNHARGPDVRSRHNLTYWRGGDYVGVGPGAHGRVTRGGVRFATLTARAIGDYIRDNGAHGEAMSAHEVATERLLMGLRTNEGVAWDELGALRIPLAALSELEDFVMLANGRLTVTRRGRPVLDYLVGKLAARGGGRD